MFAARENIIPHYENGGGSKHPGREKKKGQTVVVVMEAPSVPTCMVRVMRVPDRIDIRCQAIAYLEDPDEELEKDIAKALRRIIRRR